MKKKDIKELTPLFILIITVIYSFLKVTTSNVLYTGRHYIGFLLISISIICFFLNRRIYEYLIAITLTIGTINLISFTPTTFSINIMGIQIQPYSLCLLIILILILKNKYEIISKN